MHIRIGSREVKRIYIGSREVKKVYLGSTLVYDNHRVTTGGVWTYNNSTRMTFLEDGNRKIGNVTCERTWELRGEFYSRAIGYANGHWYLGTASSASHPLYALDSTATETSEAATTLTFGTNTAIWSES